MNLEVVKAISDIVGISTNVLTTSVNFYLTNFRKSNVEKFFEKLIDSKESLTSIGEREDLQRYFLSILDKVSNEANIEKINQWKNVVIRLATDFKDFDYKDNFINILDNLSVFDLTVLHHIYSSSQYVSIKESTINYFLRKNVQNELITHVLKKLSSHGLISEVFSSKESLEKMRMNARIDISDNYQTNHLGPLFIKFVSEGISTK